MHASRRTFMQALGLTVAGSMFTAPMGMFGNANAAPSRYPRNFVFCYFNGGWDSLMSLDPRDPKQLTDSAASIKQYQTELGLKRLPNQFYDGTPIEKSQILRPSGSNIGFGPAMAPFVKAGHHDVSCVVRGVMMDTVAHEVGRRYFITGEMPAGLSAVGSSWGTRIVAQEPPSSERQIPNLAVRVETYNQGLPAQASALKATSSQDLFNALTRAPGGLQTDFRKFLEDYRQTTQSKICDPTGLDSENMMSIVQSAQREAQIMLDKRLGKHFNFMDKNDPVMVGIKNRYGIDNVSGPEAQAALAFQAIKHQLSQCVSIELANGLDNHVDWTEDHMDPLYRGFKALTALVTDLKKEPHPDPNEANKGKKLIDNTTIVCFSEFARTPMINDKNGRDHFLVSSALLIGAGIPHNTVIGQTALKGMAAYPINPTTGVANLSGGTFLNPQNILASVMKSAGYNTDELRQPALDCLIRT